MDNSKTNHISLCTGYGGIDIGLKGAIRDLRTVAYCEIEAFVCANLVAKMEAGLMDPAPIWTNLKTFNFRKFHGLVDILSGGFPCQPFSAAGKRRGKEDPRHLWPWIADGIRLCEPRLCFFENVEGHISLGLPTVVSDLEELGYKVSWGIFSASEVGAPHQRKRVFILAAREDLCPQSFIDRIRNQDVAYGDSKGLEGQPGDVHGIKEPGRISAGQDGSAASCGICTWPARPGQRQHWWEPPRTLADSKRGTRLAHPDGGAVGCGGTHGLGGSQTRGKGLQQERQTDGNRLEQTDGDRGEELAHPGEQHGSGRSTRLGRGSGSEIHASRGNEKMLGQAESEMGGDLDGSACWVGHAELYNSLDNRTDELRLLGNGVVPATAENAFSFLIKEIFSKI